MSIAKPYPRIFLPQKGKGFDMSDTTCCSDSRYVDACEDSSLVNAARVIIKDYLTLIDYIEPTIANKDVFSHRTYELLLRVATEFEANCKGILQANGYAPHGNMSVVDYHKLNALMKLEQFELETQLWSPSRTIKPLAEWSVGHSLTWYQAYNHSKHNRYTNFHEASLENLFNGICSLVVILVAQFPDKIGFVSNGLTYYTNDGKVHLDNFSIKYPTFTDAECYDFDWATLSASDPAPFEQYAF